MTTPGNKPAPSGPRSGGGNLDEILRRLAALKAAGNYKGVLSAANEVLKAEPDNQEALDAKALAQNRLEDHEGALETSEIAIEGDPQDASAHANKAFALGALGDRDGMIAALKTAASLDPQFQAALDKALAAGTANLFDSPPAARQSRLAGDQAMAGGGSNREMIKWVVGAVLGFLLAAPVIFLALRKGFQSRPSPVAHAAWVEAVSAAPAAPELLTGKYELGRKLGEGGMGLVFEANDRKLNRKVAVKKMRPELKSSVSDAQRFIKEAGIVAHLSHPYIVTIHDVIEDGGELYLIFDYVDGKPLSAIIRDKKRLPVLECQKLLRYVAEALDCAHRNKILHRDLKPSNLHSATRAPASVEFRNRWFC